MIYLTTNGMTEMATKLFKSKDDFNFMDLTEDELVGFDIANNKLSVAVTLILI